MRSRSVLVVALGLLVTAYLQFGPAQSSAQSPKSDRASDEQAIRELDARWLKAVQARDASGEGAMFGKDGVAYRAHREPLVGAEAYQAYMTKFYADNPKSRTTWSTDRIHIAEAGDLAIQTGQFHDTALGPNGDREDKGRFVTVWKKTNGEWRVAHDISTTTMPERQAEKKS